jgi:uroporphyrinogen-III synthase
MSGAGLAGAGVLVTRPRHQVDELAAAIERAGGTAIDFPVMDIEGRERSALEREHASLPPPDIAIFVSANAVAFGLGLIGEDVRIAAIGPATAAAIEAAGRVVHIRPAGGFDSESLLRERELRNVRGLRVRIVRADSGRELLADTLSRRGARVDYLSVYRRLPRRVPDAELADLERRWRNGEIRFVVVMSVATLDYLLAVLPGYCRNALPGAVLVTPSSRVIQTAGEKIPALQTILAPGPQADDMVRAMTSALEQGNEPEN